MVKKSLVALDLFLGKATKEVAAAHDISATYVTNIKQEFKAKREEILKLYFTSGESRDKISAEFDQPVVEPPSTVNPHEDLIERVDILEREFDSLQRQFDQHSSNLSVVLKAAAAIPTVAPKPVEPPKPLPKLDIGSTAPPPTPDPHDYKDTRYQAGDVRRESYRVHVTHQATAQWKTCFGASSFEGDELVTDNNIRRRIIGVYFNGNISGGGNVWTVSGVNRYAVEGVRLKCCLQGDQMYISTVEKVPLDQL